MREILFRGKRTDNGEWEYGDLWCNPYGKRAVCIVSPINDQGTTGGNEVIPETVGQYTGLTDKNGRKVFEGDIVKIVDTFNGINRGVVCWCNGAFWADCTSTYGEYCFYGIDYLPVEIIGNIYDNPELLEVKQNVNSLAEYGDDKLNEPRWTEAHIKELTNEFIVIPKDTPAADVAPVVHGHWIRQDESFTRFKCSNPECGIENCSGFENYCPNCGAKMDEVSGDE